MQNKNTSTDSASENAARPSTQSAMLSSPDPQSSALLWALRDTETVGGAFRARVDSPRATFRLIAAVIDLRTRILRRPYGDQAVFVRADVFRTLGGFPCLPIMEDVELVRRLRHRGRLVVLREEAITSARRWVANGVLRNTAANWLCASLFAAGVPAGTLRRLYDRVSAEGKTNSRSGKRPSRRSRNTGVASAPSPVEVAHE